MCYHKVSSPLPVSGPGQTIGNLFEVAAHRDCPFHSFSRMGNRFVTVALIVGLPRPAVNRCAVPLQSGLSSAALAFGGYAFVGCVGYYIGFASKKQIFLLRHQKQKNYEKNKILLLTCFYEFSTLRHKRMIGKGKVCHFWERI